MKKMLKKELKNLVKLGCAKDITNWDLDDEAFYKLEKIALSVGVNGVSGYLLKHRETGKLYVILARNANLMRVHF